MRSDPQLVAHTGFEPVTLTYEDSEIPDFSNALWKVGLTQEPTKNLT
jgi:hypothetical protein